MEAKKLRVVSMRPPLITLCLPEPCLERFKTLYVCVCGGLGPQLSWWDAYLACTSLEFASPTAHRTGVMAPTCNRNTWELEARMILSYIVRSARISENPVSNNSITTQSSYCRTAKPGHPGA